MAMTEFHVEDAIALANELHAGQLDKSGRPYAGHLERVARKVRFSGGTWVHEAAAWLHDSIEDTFADADYLLRRGVPQTVVDIVVTLTHPKGVANLTYWLAIAQDPDTVLVKNADIYDNLDPERMCYLDPGTQKRLRGKYAKALHYVNGGADNDGW